MIVFDRGVDWLWRQGYNVSVIAPAAKRHRDGEDRWTSEMIPCGTLSTTVCLGPPVPDSSDGGASSWMWRVGLSPWSLPRSQTASILLAVSPVASSRKCWMPPLVPP